MTVAENSTAKPFPDRSSEGYPRGAVAGSVSPLSRAPRVRRPRFSETRLVRKRCSGPLVTKLHAKRLTAPVPGLQSPLSPPCRRFSPTRFGRRYDYAFSSFFLASLDRRCSLGCLIHDPAHPIPEWRRRSIRARNLEPGSRASKHDPRTLSPSR